MRKLLTLIALTAPLIAPVAASAENMVVLKQTLTDGDGVVTLGDIFDYAGNAAGVIVAPRNGPNAVLEAARVQAIAGQNGLYWDNPKGLRRIIVTQGADGAPPAQIASLAAPALAARKATASAGRTQEALVFTRSMNSGEVIQAADIAYQPVQAHLLNGAIGGAPQDVIGKTVRWPLREGAVVRAADLSNPVVVKKSESVKVVWSVGGVSLSMTGLAQKDGATGDVIPVVNPASKKVIDAVITGPGQAAAGPDAARLRASAPQYYSAR